MSANDDEILKKVKQWLAYADEDLRLARHGMTLSTSVPHRLIAYHAQQCAEKCFKAYLIFHHIDFPFTHNISRLLELCGEGASWTKSLMDSEELTFYAITTRYPGTEEEVTADEALRAINLATRVMESVSKVFEDEVLSAGAAGQGRVIKRVGIPPRKDGHPPGSKSLEALW